MTSSTTRAVQALLAAALAAALGTPARAAGSPAPIARATKPPTGSMVISIMPTNIIPNPDLRSISLRDGIARLTYQGAGGAQAVVSVHARGERFARSFAPGTRVVDVTGSGARAKLVYVTPGDSARHALPLSMDLQRSITKSRVAADRR